MFKDVFNEVHILSIFKVLSLAALLSIGASSLAASALDDSAAAIAAMLPLAEKGDAIVQCDLGNFYAKRGTAQDSQEAVKWYKKAADQGLADAQFRLAYSYSNGIAQDKAEAAKWYKLAAEQGHQEAQRALWLMYSEGDGVPQDGAEAVKWLHKLADQDPAYQDLLAGQYYYGSGIPKDFAQAFKWYRKAVEQGHRDSQYMLGQLYQNGEGVPQDNRRAYMWYNLASGNLGEPYGKVRDDLGANMTPEDIAKAQDMTRDCLLSYYKNCFE